MNLQQFILFYSFLLQALASSLIIQALTFLLFSCIKPVVLSYIDTEPC